MQFPESPDWKKITEASSSTKPSNIRKNHNAKMNKKIGAIVHTSDPMFGDINRLKRNSQIDREDEPEQPGIPIPFTTSRIGFKFGIQKSFYMLLCVVLPLIILYLIKPDFIKLKPTDTDIDKTLWLSWSVIFTIIAMIILLML